VSHITIILVILITSSGCEKEQGPGMGGHPVEGKVSQLMDLVNITPANKTVPAPEFELFSVDGRIISLKEYRGNVILLSFWATW